ncbi:MAG TPA: DNA-3-methyladenine glycosylase 2 family protein [Arenibaculum sp.]|nr:DNA-3-methyladenine glycosylase 2 family protein [Arenibaculum sp.]
MLILMPEGAAPEVEPGILHPARFDAACRELACRDPRLAGCLAGAGPLLPPGRRPAGFAGLVRLILEQQVSVAAADAMWRKLAQRLGTVTPGGLLELDDDELKTCGFSRPKIVYARGIANAVADRSLDFDALAGLDDEAAVAELVRFKGIGRWSAECYLLFSLGREDIWPVDDLAIIVGMQQLLGLAARPSKADLLSVAEAWRPWRSAAALLVWHLYRSMRRKR